MFQQNYSTINQQFSTKKPTPLKEVGILSPSKGTARPTNTQLFISATAASLIATSWLLGLTVA